MIAIVDYGMGNLGSVLNMFKKLGVSATITADTDKIYHAPKVLLPGVGAFDSAMQRINQMGLKEVLDYKALKEKVPVLGICLGMQLLTERSEEGNLSGLGWIKGQTFSFKNHIEPYLKIPHMGWNVADIKISCPLTIGYEGEIRFYFVHSYFVHAPENSMMKTHYGIDFDSAVIKDNIFGAQFHPEKSHKFGMRLFKNFAII